MNPIHRMESMNCSKLDWLVNLDRPRLLRMDVSDDLTQYGIRPKGTSVLTHFGKNHKDFSPRHFLTRIGLIASDTDNLRH